MKLTKAGSNWVDGNRFYNRDIEREMCRRLRQLVPHHVQQFFEHLHEHLRRAGRIKALLDDVTHVYENEMLSTRGQMNNEHYQSRLRSVLSETEYPVALELLAEAAVNNGLLSNTSIYLYRENQKAMGGNGASTVDLEIILYLLEHDGYLLGSDDGYRFVSGFLQDWWQARNGRHFVPIEKRDF